MNKKLIIIVIIILITIGVAIYKQFIEVPGNIAGQRAIEELMSQLYYEDTEKYLENIFVKNGNIKEPLPEIDNINEAPEQWIWLVLYNNLENEENMYTYEQIQEKLQILFSENFNKKFPEDGINGLIEKDTNSEKYVKVEIQNNDKKHYEYSIKTSMQEDNIYKIVIVEYIILTDDEKGTYILIDNEGKNLKQYNYNEISENEMKAQIIKDISQNSNSFTEKEITIEVNDINNLNLISIHRKN